MPAEQTAAMATKASSTLMAMRAAGQLLVYRPIHTIKDAANLALQ